MSIKKTWLGSAVIVLSGVLFAGQNASASGIKASAFGDVFSSVEARPIFNGNDNVISMPIGLGMTGEAEVMGKIHWTAGFSHYQLGRKTLSREDGFYIRDITFERRHLKSTALMGGLRYYQDPYGHSWYGGAKAGFSRVDATYLFDATDVTEVSHYIPLVLEAGQRFVVDQQMTVRIGARMSQDYVLSQQMNHRQKEQDSLELDALRYSYQSLFDVAVAYHF